jgi:transcriptional regulator with XRE-family HTH domain
MQEVKRMRNERGLTQQRLCDLADINKVTLIRIERGTGNPNVDTLEKLARALGVEVADFFRTPEPEPGPRSLGWALSAPEKEYGEWILNAESADLHRLWISIGDYAQKLEIGDEHRFVVGRSQQAINQYFRLNPPSAVRPRKGKREVETAQERAVNG